MGDDGVELAGRYEDGVAWADVAGLPGDDHFSGALEYEIEFLAGAVVVGPRGGTCREGGLGEALVLDRGVGAIKDAADGGAVFSCEWGLAG